MTPQRPALTIDLIDLFVPIYRRLWLFASIVVLITGYGIYYARSLPDLYRSSASLYPVSEAVGSSAGGLAAAFGLMGMGNLGISSNVTSQKLIAFLKSYSLGKQVFSRLHDDAAHGLYPNDTIRTEFSALLTSSPEDPRVQKTIKGLMSMLTVELDVESVLIWLSTETTDPVFSKQLIDAYIEELKGYLTHNDLTVAQKHKRFLEQQVTHNKRDLLEASKTLSRFHEIYKVKSQNPVLQIPIHTGSVGPRNDLYASLEDTPDASQPDGTNPQASYTVRDVPADVYFEYLHSQREILNLMNKSLEGEYQMALINAGRDALEFMVIDPPRVPPHKFKPNRKVTIIAAFAISLILAFGGVHLLHFLQQNYRVWWGRFWDRATAPL